ncbi:aminotransferase class I/II-fold pyridoxal phosphate-dependent enzyme [Aestuariibacter sp. A3R04]|uniref:aminotransferase class I/II-fold pyridoxal phosphate-dependent enzyme n=1 Tax=Aestuariibacter sp. A3R04 TaxID=2841571 RepID=UPI001C091B8F|nr:aminotransferase class I/II-fold pyridoxal phosphate-dependent enzyme [Aestuariibacter sp. A3R04]
MRFSDRANAISPFFAMAFSEKASALEAQGHHVIRLNIGEPDFGAPPPVVSAMQEVMEAAELPYTSALGLPALREGIARFYKHMHNLDVSADNVVVTAGASAALLLVSAALVNEGDTVMLADPAYPCNRQFIKSFGGKLQSIPCSADDRFQLTPELVRTNWNSRTRGIMLATPSNPTGTSVSPEHMQSILEFVKQQGGWRVVDEIYLNLSHDGNAQTVLAYDDEAIVINSFSKYFGMTGWRLGWCVVPDVMVPVMEKLAQNLYICPSTPAQHAAVACFTPESLTVCERRRDILVHRKNLVLQGLQDIGLSIDVTPDGAFYVYFKIAQFGLSSMEFCDRLLAEYHLALTPGNDFSESSGSDFVRLSFAASEHALEIGLHRLGQFVASLRCRD